MPIGPLWGNFVSLGTIRPFRFVKMDTTADHSVLEADANEQIIGVVDQSTKAHDSVNHAETGDEVNLQTGHVVEVEAGAAITNGLQVISDADGRATPAATTGTVNQLIFGVAMRSASAAGEIIKVFYQPVVIRPALV